MQTPSASPVARIAFVGLGTMGQPMAQHLLNAGYELVGCDPVSERSAELGIPVAVSPADAAADADVVITSLPSAAIVEDVLLGPDGVVRGARPGTLVIEMSTSPPALARRLAATLAPLDVLDAPVSGGPKGAQAATLTIMIGGEAAAVARARPILEHLGSLIVHVGAHGTGQAAKLSNNLVVGATMVALAEACLVAEREGIDPRTLYEILMASTGDSRVLRNRFPLPGADAAHPASRDFEPMFMLDLMTKDMWLGLELADSEQSEVARAALRVYERAQQAGLGDRDYSAVIEQLRRVVSEPRGGLDPIGH